jgi:hypothetical protein
MSASPYSIPSPLTSEQWEAEFVRAIEDDLQTHDDPLVVQLRDMQDNTLRYVADNVRRYVRDFMQRFNEDRSLFGAEIRQKLPSAIAGQKTTIRISETLIARFQELNLSSPDINLQHSLEMARALLTQLEFIRDHTSNVFSTKSLGYAGDLQTLCSLECFLRYRLEAFSYDTLATLLDCGRAVEGQEKEFEDGQNLRKRLETFRKNHPQLAEQTEASVRSLPRN